MPRIAYRDHRFNKKAATWIDHANSILSEYAAQGYTLTLRQLFYKFVARKIIPNTMKFYKQFGSVINNARLAGRIDWLSIIDMTRGLEAVPSWDSPKDILDGCVSSYHEDLWRTQPRRIEVWVEKDAGVSIVAPICRELDVPYLSCRGYTSQSEMWGAAMRLLGHRRNGQPPLVLHLGDHDPSGLDMSRDIEDRLEMFMGGVELKRLALNWDQIEAYAPPPNPAKITDSRAKKYIDEYGHESWELDALEPSVIVDLIRTNVMAERDEEAWDKAVMAQEKNRTVLAKMRKSLEPKPRKKRKGK